MKPKSIESWKCPPRPRKPWPQSTKSNRQLSTFRSNCFSTRLIVPQEEQVQLACPWIESTRSRGWFGPGGGDKRRLARGGGGKVGGASDGQPWNTDRRTRSVPIGMHRPWRDFCVYRSTFTPSQAASVPWPGFRNATPFFPGLFVPLPLALRPPSAVLLCQALFFQPSPFQPQTRRESAASPFELSLFLSLRETLQGRNFCAGKSSRQTIMDGWTARRNLVIRFVSIFEIFFNTNWKLSWMETSGE